ncbi:MAG: T9SS type A sorting domain-containing protein [Nonlabens sp.]
MKKILLISCILTSSLAAVAQVNVRGNSYIYSKGTDVFVKNKIDLAANTFWYLREEAQILQQNNQENKGAGQLSVYQEGNTNQYTYNYWCAPVSDASTGTDGNQGFLRTQLHYPTSAATPTVNDNLFDLTRTASQATFLATSQFDGISDDGTAFTPLRIAARYMYSYDSQANNVLGQQGWIAFQDDNTRVNTGLGFIMKGVIGDASLTTNPNYRIYNGRAARSTAGQRYDFRGRPNNGTITVGVANDNVTLVGNPYPSALDLKLFLQENASGTIKIDPVALFYQSIVATSHDWIEQNSGYGSYTPLGFASGQNDGFENNGSFVQAQFTRINNDGTIDAGTAADPAASIDGGRRYAPVGQGFFIARNNTDIPATTTSLARPATPDITAGTTISTSPNITGEIIQFNNSMRKWYRENGVDSFFERGTNNQTTTSTSGALSMMTVNFIMDNQYVRPLSFVFSPNTTFGYDYSWESPLSGRTWTDAYARVENGEYGLSSQPFSESSWLPVGIAVDPTLTAPINVEFEVSSLKNLSPSGIYLFDAQTNIFHDITSSNQSIMVDPGHHVDRFFITFQNTTLSNPDLLKLSDLNAYQNNEIRELSVHNPQAIDLKSIEIFDLAGRLVIDRNVNSIEPQYTFDTADYASGIYVVRITDKQAQVKSVKVSITN